MTELLDTPKRARPAHTHTPAAPPRVRFSSSAATAAPPRRADPGGLGADPVGLARPKPGAAPAITILPPRPRPLALVWVRRHAISLPLVLGLLAIAAVVIGSGIANYPSFGDDEGTYVAQAWAVLAHGQLAHYTYWYDHPPLGWLQLALMTAILGPLVKGASAVATARSLMLLPALASAALLYVLARRTGIRRPFAALAVLMLTLSPLGVVSLREVYLENFALPWVLGAFVLAASPSRRLWAFAGSGACFAVAILSKETMLLFLPGLVAAVVYNADRSTRAFCVAAFFAALGLIAIGYPLYALLKGELLPGPGHVSLEQAITWQLWGRPGTGSLFSAHSPARQLVSSWLQTDPWLVGLGVASVPVAVFVRRLRPVAVAMLVAVAAALHGGYLPQPFVIGLLPFCAFLFAGLLDALWQRPRPSERLRGLVRPAAVIAVGAALVAVVAPAWSSGDSYATSADPARPVAAAEHWIEAHVNRHARLLIDDTMYVDLVRAGFAQRYGAVWFYKLDFTHNLDPSIVRRLPKGWREFDYVVSTPVIGSALAQDPAGLGQVRGALAHSRTVATFGSGSSRIEVRRLVGRSIGSGHIPSVRSGGRR
jgi:hypothetical protein